ncbi:MAG: hypothetical protein SGPRY_000084 [Prymnesium sp.]
MLISLAASVLAVALQIYPDDELLQYSGYVRMSLDNERVRFTRKFGSASMDFLGFAELQGAGARVTWRTNAQRVSVHVEYNKYVKNGLCDETCTVADDKWKCYLSGPNMVCSSPSGCKGQCNNQCQLGLLIDNKLVRGACQVANTRGNLEIYKGRPTYKVMSQKEPDMHEFTLVMPWGAAVDFRGLTIEADAPLPAPKLFPMEPQPKLRLVTYGDAITQGWCSLGDSYPERIAQMHHNVESINMGIQGLHARFGAASHHGQAIAQMSPDFATMLIGMNDIRAHNTPNEVAGWIAGIVDEIRIDAPKLPLVVITPLVTGASDFEPWREAIRKSMKEKKLRDNRLLLLEGRRLLTEDYLFEGFHPTSAGMKELATNLNAELGLARVRFSLRGCTPPVLFIEGLTPRSDFLLFYGSLVLIGSEMIGQTIPECNGKAIMLQAENKIHGTSDRLGKATATIARERSCIGLEWLVLDMVTCESAHSASENPPSSKPSQLSRDPTNGAFAPASIASWAEKLG